MIISYVSRSRVTLAYFGTMAAFVGLLCLVSVATHRQAIANREAVNRIDHTGRLRMLGQRIVQKEILIRNGGTSSQLNPQLATAKNRFETTLLGLKSGNAELGLHPASGKDAIAAIARIESQLQELSKLLQRPTSAPITDAELARLSSLGDELLHACQQLILAERLYLDEGQSMLRWIVWGCIFSVLLLGAATLWLSQRSSRLLLAEETARRTAELLAATRENEARLEGLMASSPDPLITADSQGLILAASDSVESVLGWKREELIGQDVNVVIPEPYRSEYNGYLAHSQGTGKLELPENPRELPVLRRDGSVFPATVTIWQVDLPDESQPLFMGTIHDITERKRSEAELESLNKQLTDTARQAGKAEIATSVLHNVGNVLNSVNVSAGLIQDVVRKSGASSLGKAVGIMEQHLDDLAAYVTQDERGKHLPRFLIEVSQQMAGEEEILLEEIKSLINNIDHIKAIVATQQAYAKGVSGVIEEVSLAELLEDAIHINRASMKRHCVEIHRDFDEIGPVHVDKQKLLQIIVNLISNAKYACMESGNDSHQLTVSLRRQSEDHVSIEVRDNGIGIAAENLTRIFAHGFSTRQQGHGFGLHSAANAAQELDGHLTVHSDGPGQGATFTLELPYEPAGVSLCTT